MILGAMPAFNEEKSIAKVLLGVRQHVDEVLVVDDGSTDATEEIANALGARVIKHPSNRGYGGALQTIFITAQELGADALVIIDADGQHNPEDIPKLLGELQKGADIVIGSRFLEGMEASVPGYRKIGMKVLDIATYCASATSVTDSQSGFRAYGQRAINALKIHGSGMSAGSEILVQIKDHDLHVAEVPIRVDYAGDTSTHNPFYHGMSVLFNVFGFMSHKKPLVVLSLPGALFMVTGLWAGIIAFSQPSVAAYPLWVVAMVIGILLSMGLILINAGILLNSVEVLLKSRGL